MGACRHCCHQPVFIKAIALLLLITAALSPPSHPPLVATHWVSSGAMAMSRRWKVETSRSGDL
jgi:hypothetical protein